MGIARLVLALFFAHAALGCVAHPRGYQTEGSVDGARCDEDGDCRSGACNLRSKLCAHSLCDCPGNDCQPGGEASYDCQSDWVCVYYETVFGDLGEFFGAERDRTGGRCQPLCDPKCPEHYVCKDGHFCVVDHDWANPVPTLEWSGAASGELTGSGQSKEVDLERGRSVSLRARAESPIGSKLAAFQWTFVSSDGARVELEGEQVDLELPEELSYRRAELAVSDSSSRTGSISVSFMGCSGAGRTCGYEGSGCCKGCDRTQNECM